MADQLQLRGGTTTEHATFTGALREVTVDTTKKTLVVHDNATAGGTPLAKENLSNVPAGSVTSTMILDGTIVDGDINASAAIGLSKLATGALPTAITVASANIVDGTIVNADINASAAIAGTKVSPDFGSQNTTTTGTSTAASFIPSSSTAPSNGLYLPAANSVALATGGSGRLFVGSSGNVGIGTASPSNLLHVSGTGTVAQLASSNNNNLINLKGNGATNGVWLGTTSSDDFLISNGASVTERLRITSGGLVGIGNSSPNSPLDVVGTNRSIQFGSATQKLFAWSDSQGISLLNADSQAGDGFYINRTNSYVQIWTGSTPRLTVDSSGRCGIGDNAPGVRLSVLNGTDNSDVAVFSGGDRTRGLKITTGAAGGNNDALVQLNAQTSTGQFAVLVNGSEACRVDNSKRLLVGTSSARSNVVSRTPLAQFESATAAYTGLSIINNSTAGYDPALFLGNTKGTAAGSNALVANGDGLGSILFAGADGTNLIPGAEIRAFVDAAPGLNDMPTRLVFSTTADGAASPTERMRITNDGFFCASSTGSQASTTQHNFSWNQGQRFLFSNTSSTSANNLGLQVNYTGTPNGTGNEFLFCSDTAGATLRASIRSNGGLANFSANNVNLSDRNVKKDIAPAAGTWDCLKEWEIVNFRYKDQPDDADLNMGVIAQQVAESCPEVIQVFQEAKEATDDQPAQEERIGVKEQQMMWMAIKALQEAQLRIESLEAANAELTARVSVLEQG